MKKFTIELFDSKTKFSKIYNILSQDEPTALTWAEKQRNVFLEAYRNDELDEDISNPKKWNIKIIQG